MNISTKLNPAPQARVGRSVLTHSYGPRVCFAVAFSVAQKTNESTALLSLLCSVSDEHVRDLVGNMPLASPLNGERQELAPTSLYTATLEILAPQPIRGQERPAKGKLRPRNTKIVYKRRIGDVCDYVTKSTEPSDKFRTEHFSYIVT